MYKKIAPVCYLTPLGFIIAALHFASRDEKCSADQFHLRQSFGLYRADVQQKDCQRTHPMLAFHC